MVIISFDRTILPLMDNMQLFILKVQNIYNLLDLQHNFIINFIIFLKLQII